MLAKARSSSGYRLRLTVINRLVELLNHCGNKEVFLLRKLLFLNSQ